MRLVAMGASLMFATPAFAGGLGVVVAGGAHTEPLFYYSKFDANGNEYPDMADYEKYKLVETLPNMGLGLNLLLGDRDDKIVGDARLYWMMDSAQVNPAEAGAEVPAANVVAEFRDAPKHVGIGSIGLSWGIVGDPAKFQLNAVGHVGTAFITSDHTEFLLADIGPGVTLRATRQVQLFAEAVYQARYRKVVTHSVNAFAGARYMFD